MSLISKILGRHPAKDYLFICYKSDRAGYSTIARKTKNGYKDLLNYSHFEDWQIEFQKLFIDYFPEIDAEQLVAPSEVRNLGLQKISKFHADYANSFKIEKEENAEIKKI